MNDSEDDGEESIYSSCLDEGSEESVSSHASFSTKNSINSALSSRDSDDNIRSNRETNQQYDRMKNVQSICLQDSGHYPMLKKRRNDRNKNDKFSKNLSEERIKVQNKAPLKRGQKKP